MGEAGSVGRRGREAACQQFHDVLVPRDNYIQVSLSIECQSFRARLSRNQNGSSAPAQKFIDRPGVVVRIEDIARAVDRHTITERKAPDELGWYSTTDGDLVHAIVVGIEGRVVNIAGGIRSNPIQSAGGVLEGALSAVAEQCQRPCAAADQVEAGLQVGAVVNDRDGAKPRARRYRRKGVVHRAGLAGRVGRSYGTGAPTGCIEVKTRRSLGENVDRSQREAGVEEQGCRLCSAGRSYRFRWRHVNDGQNSHRLRHLCRCGVVRIAQLVRRDHHGARAGNRQLVAVDGSRSGENAEHYGITRCPPGCAQRDRSYSVQHHGWRRKCNCLRRLIDQYALRHFRRCRVIRVAQLVRRDHHGARAGNRQLVAVDRSRSGENAEDHGIARCSADCVQCDRRYSKQHHGGWRRKCNCLRRLVHRQRNRRGCRRVVRPIGRRKSHRQQMRSGSQHAASRAIAECSSHSRACIQLRPAQRRSVGDRRRCGPCNRRRRLVHRQRHRRGCRRVVRPIGRRKSHRQQMRSGSQHAASRAIAECSSHSRACIQLRPAQRRSVGDRRRCGPCNRRRRLVHRQRHRRGCRGVIGPIRRGESHRQQMRTNRQDARGWAIAERSSHSRASIQLRPAQRHAVRDRSRCRPCDCRCRLSCST